MLTSCGSLIPQYLVIEKHNLSLSLCFACLQSEGTLQEKRG